MKKLLFFMLALVSTQFCFAQVDIDEDDLVGKWSLESADGSFNYKDKNADYSFNMPDSLEVYTETQHSENPESLGVAKYKHYEEEHIYYDYITGEPITIEAHYSFLSCGISDIYITKNDVLHILLRGGHYILRYRILAYDGERITLQTMDKEGTLVYQRTQTTGIATTRAIEEKNDYYYSLNGIRYKAKPRGEAYIRKGKVYY